MSAEDSQAHDAPIVRIGDETVIEGRNGLDRQLRTHLATGARFVVADVSAVRRLSSTAVAALLGAHRVCRARGGSVVVRNANRRTRDVLSRSGLAEVFRIEVPPDHPAR
ncbi:STAS domain-containing protein [Flindersiella endophytica]